MQALSLQSIFLFYGIFLFSTALLIAWLFRQYADVSARCWIAATLMSGVATCSTAWRAELAPWLSYLLPNILELAHALVIGISLWTLTQTVSALRPWFLSAALITGLFAAGLTLLWAWLPSALVPYVSLGNAAALLVPAWIIGRHARDRPDLRHVLRLSQSLAVFGLLWLLRVPVYFLGLGQHAMDPQWANWLIFVGLLVAGIFLQFAYIGLRFSSAYDNRLALAQTQARLERLLNERAHLSLAQHAPYGALATQIAHEVNQPLAAIRLSLESMVQQPRLQGERDVGLVEVLKDLDRISLCLDNARQLTQTAQPQLQAVSATDFLRAVAGLLPPTVPVRTHLASQLLRLDLTLLTAALKTLLELLGREPGVMRSLALQEASAGYARLRMEVAPQALSADETATLNGEELKGQSGTQASSLVLDLLTVYHLIRLQAGRSAAHLGAHEGMPQSLLIDVLIPLVSSPNAVASEAPLATASAVPHPLTPGSSGLATSSPS